MWLNIRPCKNTTGVEKPPTFHFKNGKKLGGSLRQFPPKERDAGKLVATV
jgi:hypothetical protein